MDISHKEVYKMFFMIKGHLEVTEETARNCYDGYFPELGGIRNGISSRWF